MLNCKQVTDLASNSLDTTLSWSEKWQMKLHLLICKACQRYLQQLRFIHKASKALEAHYKDMTLSIEAKNRIREKLNKEKS